MSTTPAATSQTHAVRIGDFELSFIVRVWWCSGEPGGWRWSAIAEDDMTDWISGRYKMATAERALEAAVAHLTAIFS